MSTPGADMEFKRGISSCPSVPLHSQAGSMDMENCESLTPL